MPALRHGMAVRSSEGKQDKKEYCPEYPNYGGRGIHVTERWHRFENFLGDMGNKQDGLSIERIDVNLGYFPGNCRWAPIYEQNRNKRVNVYLDHGGS